MDLDMELSGDEMIVIANALKSHLANLSRVSTGGLDGLRKLSDKVTALAIEAGPAGYALKHI